MSFIFERWFGYIQNSSLTGVSLFAFNALKMPSHLFLDSMAWEICCLSYWRLLVPMSHCSHPSFKILLLFLTFNSLIILCLTSIEIFLCVYLFQSLSLENRYISLDKFGIFSVLVSSSILSGHCFSPLLSRFWLFLLIHWWYFTRFRFSLFFSFILFPRLDNFKWTIFKSLIAFIVCSDLQLKSSSD